MRKRDWFDVIIDITIGLSLAACIALVGACLYFGFRSLP